MVYNPQHYRTAKEKTKAVLTEFRKAGCKNCGERDEACLAAHHVDGKDESVNRLCAGSGSRRRLVEELKKCICLCHNCHAKFHAGRTLENIR